MNGVKSYFSTTVKTLKDNRLQAGWTRQLEPHLFLQHQRLRMLPLLKTSHQAGEWITAACKVKYLAVVESSGRWKFWDTPN